MTNLYSQLIHIVQRAIRSVAALITIRAMPNNDLVEALQRGFTSIRALLVNITRDISTIEQQLAHIDGLVEQLAAREEGCSICRETLAEPMKTACGHVFCNRCITEWLATINHTTCPTCRTHVATTDLRPVTQEPGTAAEVYETTSSEISNFVARLQSPPFKLNRRQKRPRSER